MYTTALEWAVVCVSLSIFLAAECGAEVNDSGSALSEHKEFNVTLADNTVDACNSWRETGEAIYGIDSYCKCILDTREQLCTNTTNNTISDDPRVILLYPICERLCNTELGFNDDHKMEGNCVKCDNCTSCEMEFYGQPLWLLIAAGSGICIVLVLIVSVSVCCVICCCFTCKRSKGKENKTVDYSDSWDSVEGEEEEEEETNANKPTSEIDPARIRNVYVPDNVRSGPVATEAAPPTRKAQHVPLNIQAAKAKAQPESYEEAAIWRQDVKSASVYALNVEALDTIYDDIHSAVTDMRPMRGGGEMKELGHGYTHLMPDMQAQASKYTVPLPFKNKGRSNKRKYYVTGKPRRPPPPEPVQLHSMGGRPYFLPTL